MLAFPQLSTGAGGQFPLARTRVRRTVLNDLADGRTVRYGDELSERAWAVDLRELTVAERSAIEGLFSDTGGRLRTFTFLDPADNLLRWSETLSNSAWSKDPLLTLTAGAGDPLGTSRATHMVNSGQANQGIGQTLPVPGSFTYCMSAWIKGSGRILLQIGAGSKGFEATATWTRIVFAATTGAAGDSVVMRLVLEAGAAVDAFGIQVEGQPGASGYKATESQSGVYSRARFASDELNVVAEGHGRDRVSLRIVAVAEN